MKFLLPQIKPLYHIISAMMPQIFYLHHQLYHTSALVPSLKMTSSSPALAAVVVDNNNDCQLLLKTTMVLGLLSKTTVALVSYVEDD